MAKPGRFFKYFVICLVLGVLVTFVDRLYYAFVFLPKYHGSFVDAAVKIIDVPGWKAYMKSLPNIIFKSLEIVCFGACFVMLWLFSRK